MYRLTVAMLFAVLALTVSASPTPINPTTAVPKSWTVQAYPGGPNLILYGTAEAVYTQLKQINPHYDEDWKNTPVENPFAVATASASVSASVSASSSSSERGEKHLQFKRHTLKCINPKGGMEEGAKKDMIKDGIKRIRQLQGSPGLYPGECKTVSCSWGDTISWCNTDSANKFLPSYDNIADGAQVIMNECADKDTTDAQGFGGELDHPDNWKVVVDGYKTR